MAAWIRDYLESDALLGPHDVCGRWLSENGTLDGLVGAVAEQALDALETYVYQDRVGDLMDDMAAVFADALPESERTVWGLRRALVAGMVKVWRRTAIESLIDAGSDADSAAVEVALGAVPMPVCLANYKSWVERSGL